MIEVDFGSIRLAGFAAAYAFAVVWQQLAPHGREPGSLRVNGRLWLVNAILIGGLCGACVCHGAVWASHASVGLFNMLGTPSWLAAVAAVPLLDLVAYGLHRASHRWGPLWRFHQVHHSDRSFTVSTAVRFHPGELLISLPVRLCAVIILGVPVAGVVAFELIFTLFNAVEHGDIALPARLERRASRWIVTPALHRWHHTIDGHRRDTNFGTIFSLWDRLMGTAVRTDSTVVVRTGLRDVTDVSFAAALVMPARRAAE